MYGGTSYYWRGAVTNNYVAFAGFCWRIVRINGDKTMRLIYDGTSCYANGYGKNLEQPSGTPGFEYNTSANQSNYVGWTYEGQLQRPTNNATAIASNAKTQLDNWYSANITGKNATKVAQGKYCNDRNAQSGSTWSINGSTFYYAGFKRVYIDYAPTLSCPNGDVYHLSVGLITMDETMYAGGTLAYNDKYYLYNYEEYWTMSPSSWGSDGASMFYVFSGGNLNWTNVSHNGVDYALGLRPVINLKADTLFKVGGTGTLSNPYVELNSKDVPFDTGDPEVPIDPEEPPL